MEAPTVVMRTITIPQYRARPGSHLNDRDAQVIGEELQRIAGGDGSMVESTEIVEAAKSPESPLHEFFEWNDSEAAHQYRLVQARRITGAIMVEVISKEQPETPVLARAFYNVVQTTASLNPSLPPEKRRGYVTVETAVSTSDYLEQVIEMAENQLLAWRRRVDIYANDLRFLARFGRVLDAIDMLNVEDLAEEAPS